MKILVMKKLISILFLSVFITACNAKPSPQEELNIQAGFLPTILGIDGGVYALAMKEPSTALTQELYKTAVLKLGLLKRYESQAKGVQIEKQINIVQINSLCLMGKFVESNNHQPDTKMDKQYHASLIKWIEDKQKIWKPMLEKEGKNAFDYPCI